MSRENVEKFLKEYADPTTGLAKKFDANAKDTVDNYIGLSDEERALLTNKKTHELRDYLKDKYAAALQVHFA